MSELSGALMVSNGNVTGIINRLDEEGFVERKPLEEDRRTFVAKLSPEGKKRFRKMAKAHETWIDHMYASLSDGEIQELMDSLDMMKSSLKTYEMRNK